MNVLLKKSMVPPVLVFCKILQIPDKTYMVAINPPSHIILLSYSTKFRESVDGLLLQCICGNKSENPLQIAKNCLSLREIWHVPSRV